MERNDDGRTLPELDERFSDPGAQGTPWTAAREVLETAQFSWTTTVRADGRPHVTALLQAKQRTHVLPYLKGSRFPQVRASVSPLYGLGLGKRRAVLS
jgi:hypothetical protein